MVLLSTLSFADELSERAAVRELAAAAFLKADFAELERQADQYRSNALKTSSGTWKLPFFYRGIGREGLNFTSDEDANWREALSTFELWIAEYPSSSTPYVAYGTAIMQRAWRLRGEGSAKTIPAENVGRYRKLLVESAEYLMEHKEIGSKDPHWYRSVADALSQIGVDKQVIIDIADEGLSHFPNYDEIYFVVADRLSPKWGGSSELVENFAREAVERTKGHRGYALYARIYWAVGYQGKGWYLFQYPTTNWKNMVTGMDDVLAKYPSQWNINNFAFFACYRPHYPTAQRYLSMIEGPILKSVWLGSKIYDKCQRIISSAPSANHQTSSP